MNSVINTALSFSFIVNRKARIAKGIEIRRRYFMG